MAGNERENGEERLRQLAAAEEVSAAELDEAEAIVSSSESLKIPDELAVEEREQSSASETQTAAAAAGCALSEKHSDDVRQLISNASIPQKIKLAMFGNATCRTLLIRDANRMIQEFALRNPRMQLREIEEFSRDPNMSQHVLRRISENQAWMRSYIVKVNLVSNPKTPGDISLKWLRHLNTTDVRRLSKSKNVPQVVSTMARKRIADEAKRK